MGGDFFKKLSINVFENVSSFLYSTNIFWTPICMDLRFLGFAEKRNDSAVCQKRGESRVYKEEKGSYFMWQVDKIFDVSPILCNTVPLFLKREWGRAISAECGLWKDFHGILLDEKVHLCEREGSIYLGDMYVHVCVCFLLLIKKKLVAGFPVWG